MKYRDDGLEGIGRALIILGVVIVVVGVIFLLAPRVPFLGRLPGDFVFRRGDATFIFPLATSIIISLVLTIILNIVFRIFR